MQLEQLLAKTKSSSTRSPGRHMGAKNPTVQADNAWDVSEWSRREACVASRIINSDSPRQSRVLAARWGRKILRAYSSSFFAVTRWLPPEKRADVEIVYSAVRYPDEVVDTFHLDTLSRIRSIEQWRDKFQVSDSFDSIQDAVAAGVPVPVAGFRDVARRKKIPDHYYVSFLEAMNSDIEPRTFENWDHLISGYIYGSATVVGYFLSHIYGAAPGHDPGVTKASARALAIALQLTNFSRDVDDDAARGRCYLPSNITSDAGRPLSEAVLERERDAISQAQFTLAREARRWYAEAMPGIPSFNSDSRLAIEACHRLYYRLNEKILAQESQQRRASLSTREKLSVLPRSKYWRLPMALVFER